MLTLNKNKMDKINICDFGKTLWKKNLNQENQEILKRFSLNCTESKAINFILIQISKMV